MRPQNRPKEDRRGAKEAFRGSVKRKKREEDTRRAVEEDRERDKQRQSRIHSKIRGAEASPK